MSHWHNVFIGIGLASCLAALPDNVTAQSEKANPDAASNSPRIPVPKILALTWQTEDRAYAKFSDAPYWEADGELLSEEATKALQAEIRGTRILSHQEQQAVPLILVFDVGAQLQAGTGGVQVTCEFSDGATTSVGTRLNRQAGLQTATRMFAISSITRSFQNRTFEWPKSVTLNLKYPVEERVLIKTLREVPKEPIRLAKGISWAVEPETGFRPGGDGQRYPAAVLEVSRKALDLISYDVRVYEKDQERPVRGSYSTIRERDGERFEIRVSERFPAPDQLDRIEIYRQRFRRTRLFDVPLRTDLLPVTDE